MVVNFKYLGANLSWKNETHNAIWLRLVAEYYGNHAMNDFLVLNFFSIETETKIHVITLTYV